MCFLLKHNIGDSIVHWDAFIDHYIDDIKTIHHTVLVVWLVTGFWIVAKHYVMSYDIMASYCDVTWPFDVTLWCHVMSHNRHNMLRRNEWWYMWFTNTPESVPARTRRNSSRRRRHLSSRVTTIGDTSRARCLLITCSIKSESELSSNSTSNMLCFLCFRPLLN